LRTQWINKSLIWKFSYSWGSENLESESRWGFEQVDGRLALLHVWPVRDTNLEFSPRVVSLLMHTLHSSPPRCGGLSIFFCPSVCLYLHAFNIMYTYLLLDAGALLICPRLNGTGMKLKRRESSPRDFSGSMFIPCAPTQPRRIIPLSQDMQLKWLSYSPAGSFFEQWLNP